MSRVNRVYVEKKPDFAVQAKELKHEVKHYLGIAADQVRVLIRYDVENVSDATYQKALQTVFSEPPVDDIYEENFDAEGGNVFSVLLSVSRQNCLSRLSRAVCVRKNPSVKYRGCPRV